ncbi:hypothetical protein VFES401_11280 [Aliivibrio fischeri]|uniref:hypothetical protein n=1 Tax=Aliivibrio fischeri TaxID=668 RepID=UPI0007C53538|nr:hypothetical protein [Aliivibrio fischeri]TGA70292.1 hypothetical protein VFES401_11280 [Aliivibrio fischeri]
MRQTIIVSTYQSFIDMCMNGLVDGKNIHCTFPLMVCEIEGLNTLLIKHGGHEMTVTKSLII